MLLGSVDSVKNHGAKCRAIASKFITGPITAMSGFP